MMTQAREIPNLNVSLITKKDIRAVLAYIPYFQSGAAFGEWEYPENKSPGSVPYPMLSEQAGAFVQTCYTHNFVQAFNWGEWIQEHQDLAENDSGIEKFDLEGVVKLLTSLIRGDRFCGGLILEAMNTGKILRILRRLESVHGSSQIS
jgi:hypothetical protein